MSSEPTGDPPDSPGSAGRTGLSHYIYLISRVRACVYVELVKRANCPDKLEKRHGQRSTVCLAELGDCTGAVRHVERAGRNGETLRSPRCGESSQEAGRPAGRRCCVATSPSTGCTITISRSTRKSGKCTANIRRLVKTSLTFPVLFLLQMDQKLTNRHQNTFHGIWFGVKMLVWPQ